MCLYSHNFYDSTILHDIISCTVHVDGHCRVHVIVITKEAFPVRTGPVVHTSPTVPGQHGERAAGVVGRCFGARIISACFGCHSQESGKTWPFAQGRFASGNLRLAGGAGVNFKVVLAYVMCRACFAIKSRGASWCH